MRMRHSSIFFWIILSLVSFLYTNLAINIPPYMNASFSSNRINFDLAEYLNEQPTYVVN